MAEFNDPFSESDTRHSPKSQDESVSPEDTNILAEDPALREDVPPSDTASLADATASGSGPQEPRIAFAGANAGSTEARSEDDIEKPSTGSATASRDSSPHNRKHGEAYEKIKGTANRMADKFHISHIRVAGPSRLFNPTSVRARIRRARGHDDPDTTTIPGDTDLELLWRARDNRKGRGSIAVRSSIFEQESNEGHSSLRRRKTLLHLRNAGNILKRMLTTFPYWDMAFWSGWSYTIGSALFVLDGAFAWLPAAFPATEFPGEGTYGVPLCFFFGALFFQIGATVAYFEAVNDGSFHGSAMRRLMEGHEEEQKAMLDEKIHDFFGHFRPHHRDPDVEAAERLAGEVDPEAGWKAKEGTERPGSIYPPAKHPGRRRGAMDMGEAEEGQSSTYLTWRWWPR